MPHFHMTRSRLQTALFAITGISILIALAAHGYLGTYSRYLADDFCSAGMARRLGVLRAVWYWYLNWTGRYAASGLDAVFGLIGPTITPLVTALVLLLWLAILALTSHALLERQGGRRRLEAALIAAAILYVTLTLSPNVPQSLYWGQGMRSIVPPLILTTLLVYWLIRTLGSGSPGQGALLRLLGIFALALLIGGFNETIAALQFGGLAFAWLLSRILPNWRIRRGWTGALLAGTLGAAVAVTIVALSPGNEIRQAFYPPPAALPQLLQMAWVNFCSFLGSLAREPQQILAILGSVALLAVIGLRSQQGPQNLTTPAMVLAAGAGLAFAAFIPAAYGLSDAPPERTLLVPAHLLTITLALEGFFLGCFLRQRGIATRMSLETTILLLMASVLIVSATLLTAGEILSNRASYLQYAKHWDAVDSQIVMSRERGENTVWIQPIRNWAGLNEPNDNPKFWLNRCLRDYYGIEVLGLDIP